MTIFSCCHWRAVVTLYHLRNYHTHRLKARNSPIILYVRSKEITLRKVMKGQLRAADGHLAEKHACISKGLVRFLELCNRYWLQTIHWKQSSGCVLATYCYLYF